jgi:hypothetical protein
MDQIKKWAADAEIEMLLAARKARGLAAALARPTDGKLEFSGAEAKGLADVLADVAKRLEDVARDAHRAG